MNKKLTRVHEIALEVRSWCENEADKARREDNLVGYCAIASAELHKRLMKVGIQSEIHMHNGDFLSHVFLTVEDHVVDVTATQFSEFRYHPVVIIHCKEAQQYEFFETDETFVDVMSLRKYQAKYKWPANQIAYAVSCSKHSSR
jgi:hypothetical protein